MVSNPIICCSVTHWVSTPRGMKHPQRIKTLGAFRPLERGMQCAGSILADVNLSVRVGDLVDDLH